MDIPPINLAHVRHMTDQVSIFQHANGSVPNIKEGYTTDDTARALILTTMLENELPNEVFPLSRIYLDFMTGAFNIENKRFRNFLTFDRTWIPQEQGKEGKGSNDSQGRALLGLAYATQSQDKEIREQAQTLYAAGTSTAENLDYIRSQAFFLLSLSEQRDALDQKASLEMMDRTYTKFKKNDNGGSHDWPWVDEFASYSNATIPHAYLRAGTKLNDRKGINRGLDLLEWLDKVQTRDGHFVPIGCKGFYRKGNEPARYDQQPVEAQEMVHAMLSAFEITQETYWLEGARRALNWFSGNNDARTPMYNSSTGGGYDGLGKGSINSNQGAESTLAPLLAITDYQTRGV